MNKKKADEEFSCDGLDMSLPINQWQQAIETRDANEVARLLKSHPEFANTKIMDRYRDGRINKEDHHQEALDHVARTGHVEIAKLLVEAGANEERIRGAFMIAEPNVAEFLLGHCDDPAPNVGLMAYIGKAKALQFWFDRGYEPEMQMLHDACCGRPSTRHFALRDDSKGKWKENFRETVRVLIDAGADVNERTLGGNVKWDGAKPWRKNRETPLHIAATSHDIVLIRQLLDAGADKTLKNDLGETPCCWAIRYGAPEEVIKALEFEGYSRHNTISPSHPFIVAVRELDLEQVEYILSRDNAAVNTQVRGGVDLTGNEGKEFAADETDEHVGPLHFAAFHGHRELEQLLIDEGADFHATSYFGKKEATPVTLACWEGDPATILNAAKAADIQLDLGPGLFTTLAHGGNADLLMEHGAKHDVFTAAMAGELETLKQLLDEDPKSFDQPHPEYGRTPLEQALTVGQIKSAELLADRGAEVPAHAAASMGRVEEIKTLLDKDKEAATRMFGTSPLLCWAIMGGQVEMVKFLLENGADPEGADEWDVTPLRYSTQVKGDKGAAIVDLLFAAGADIDRVSRGVTPMQSALDNKNRHVHHRLIYHKENSVSVSEFEAKFWQAVNDGDLATAKSSLEEDSSLASKRFPTHNRIFYCTDGFPLHVAARNAHWGIAQLLLDHGADPDAKRDLEEIGGEHRDFGMPLYFAAEKRNYHFANVLMDHGASPNGYPYCDQAVIERMFYQVNEAVPDIVMRRAYASFLPDQAELESQTVADLVGDESDDSIKLFARMVDAGAQPPFTALVREGYHDLALEIVGHSRDKDGTPHDYPSSTAWNNITGAARWYGYPGLFRRLMEHPNYRYSYDDTMTTIDVAIRSHNRDGSYADYRKIIVMQLEALKANDDLGKARQDANFQPFYHMAGHFTWGNNYGYRAAIAEPECFIDLAELFVSWGFDNIEYRDPDSNHSPLSAAVERGSPGIETYIRWLVRRGADLRKSDPDEVNPLAIATEKGFDEVREILLNQASDD